LAHRSDTVANADSDDFRVDAFSPDALWSAFHSDHSSSKHLLTVYSAAVGLGAQYVAEIGIGATTQALRAAMEVTGGTLYSCDGDRARFESLLDDQDQHWRLFLGPSDEFLRGLEGPIDLLMHDGAHDYHQVRADLELALPKLRTFGLVLIHDTQQPDLAGDMLAAVRDATADSEVSFTNLPYSAGLGVLRLERGRFPAGEMASGRLPDGRSETAPVPVVTRVSPGARFGEVDTRRGRLRRVLRRRARRAIKGF
jgi:hypothetical protein